MRIVLLLTLVVSLPTPAFSVDVPEVVTNTQEETHPLLSPEDALNRLHLPEGFRATVFAAEPEVRQPIAITFDTRGRIWIAENDTYSDNSVGYDLKQHDRILIFEDTDQDGRADSRKVFWDQAQHLTSVEVGFGGVWVLCAPDLLFIPDRDNDDVPDAEPIVMLTGFNNSSIRHNIVNGLKWGPDGWLYGRHGITTTSFVGTPETPEELRTPMNCSIWRFHPVTHEFEVVVHGTTNSWGHDWNEYGELFFINTVIGHLWHAVPGAHFERMFGEDFNPHLYRLMPQTADHFHWDTTEKWSDIRNSGVSSTTDAAGGGHAHCGMMIYQGLNWPQRWRGRVMTLNLHGRRINSDTLERHGAGYIGRHDKDFAASDDLWFRGVELAQGPDGGVYVLDWSDIGECHENDGIHRTSGRVYKIVYGNVQPPPQHDIRQLNPPELIAALLSEDAWQHRMARRVIQEKFVANEDPAVLRDELLSQLGKEPEPKRLLRGLAAVRSVNALHQDIVEPLLKHPHESVRVWAVRALADAGDPDRLERALTTLVQREDSGLVLLHIASAMQRLTFEQRFDVTEQLLQRGEYAEDRHLPLMIWYGIEPAVPHYPKRAIELLQRSRMPEIQQFISRRIAADSRKQSAAVVQLLATSTAEGGRLAVPILNGIRDALDGWRKAEAPENWSAVSQQLAALDDQRTNELVRELSVIFGDGRAVDELREVAASSEAAVATRRNAIRALVTARDAQSRELLQSLLDDRELAVNAIRGLAVIGDDKTPHLIVKKFPSFRGHIKPVAIETLASRPEYALVLLNAVEAGTIPIEELPPFYVRQMRSFEHDELQAALRKVLPEWRHTSAEKEQRTQELRQLLTADALSSADLSRGRMLFEKTCANCHKLYGKGGTLGPDLTGSQRSNLNYLLGNIVDPSAEVAEKFQMSILVLTDGRVVSGVVQRENEETIVVQTPNEELTLLKSDVEARKNSKLSMMPERQLDKMTDQDIIHLFGYLMSPQQVPAASASTGRQN